MAKNTRIREFQRGGHAFCGMESRVSRRKRNRDFADIISYDFKNKRVGVIGGGSSSIQIVPNLQKLEGINLTCFVRSRTWISNPFGDSAMEKLGLDPAKLDCKTPLREQKAI